jgi:catechol 2,3-dioxygenase-like lactoylglutathione lyase family enzyme
MLSTLPVAATLPFEGLKAAQQFYAKKLGLRRVAGSVSDGFLEFRAGKGTRIGVFESDSKKSEDTAATFDVADLAKEMATLRRKGVVFEEYDLPGIKTVNGVATMGGMTAAWFKDPGGNILCLHQAKRASPKSKRTAARTRARASGKSARRGSRATR